jgi:predicted metal-binding membrane protein
MLFLRLYLRICRCKRELALPVMQKFLTFAAGYSTAHLAFSIFFGGLNNLFQFFDVVHRKIKQK